MLILIGPDFQATEPGFQRLAQLTGLVAYDLKTKLRPGAWGVLRVLADAERATELATQLKQEGFPAVLVNAEVPFEQSRRMVPIERLSLDAGELLLGIQGQTMRVPCRALLTIVRGEAHIRSERHTGASSGNAYRAVVPTTQDIQAFRDSQVGSSYESYHVADLHFATVPWAARLDARKTDVTAFDVTGSPVQKLDRVVDSIAAVAGTRVDRGVRTSSLASFATRPQPIRSVSPAPGSPVTPLDRRGTPSDPQFDGYSRLVAEAERVARGLTIQSPDGVPD